MITRSSAAAFVLIAGLAGPRAWGAPASGDAVKARVFPADFGTDAIDVAAFPKALQETYPVFRSKCSQCHTIARPINSAFAGDDWRLYVNQMRHKPNSGINGRTAARIIPFLQYWSEHRAAAGWKAPVVSAETLAAAAEAGSATIYLAAHPAAVAPAPAPGGTAAKASGGK